MVIMFHYTTMINILLEFERNLNDEKWVVIINFTNENAKIKFAYSNPEVIISNSDSLNLNDDMLELDSYDAFVFRV